MERNTNTEGEDLFDPLNDPKQKEYQEEARQRWGHTDAYKQSQERVKNFTKEDWKTMQQETEVLMRDFVSAIERGVSVESEEGQALVARHYASINRFYDCTAEIYRGLADMYLADERFMQHYAAHHADLPEYLAHGMHIFADTLPKRV